MKNSTKIILVIIVFAAIITFFKGKKSQTSQFQTTKKGTMRKS